ncbi:hypothetical protein LIER_24305 [Lithospermum erythrorhizon]|uniref:Nuclease associated modular domain-containing protein n=1 Tax=Lithospermum erythrorhizon TaxID=34254 RepID=A0AAV3R0J5_LITER
MMGLLDIATTQPCSQNNAYAISIQPHFCKKFHFGNQKGLLFSGKYFSVPEKVKQLSSIKIDVSRGRLVIRAVATFKCIERTEFTEQLGGYQNLRMGFESSSSTPMITEKLSTDEDSAEMEESEKLRRSRISKANKGKTPWNKGRKHSEETLRRIRERTKLAMQNPKVKMKLVKLGHAQSEDTKIKIGLGVRMGWERRRQKLMLQETCCCEWQNLIADASRKGLLGEEQLQWDSYAILDKQLKEEWMQSVEQRKKMPRPKGSKRAPKSEEQRRKISEAISAKWADPTYRTRVTSALAKFHGIPEGVVRKPRRKTSGDGERRRSVLRKNIDELVKLESKSNNQIQRVKLRKRKAALFKDPLASSKLDMLMNIRAKRAAAENKQAEAVARAKALISESEKAAKALEAAVEKNPLAQESLIEARMLIAEAKQLIESIEKAELSSHVNGTSSVLASFDLVAYSEDKLSDDAADRKVNGSKCLGTSPGNIDDLVPNNFAKQNKVNGERYEGLSLKSKIFDLPNGDNSLSVRSSDYDLSPEELNNMIKHPTFQRHYHSAAVNGSQKNTELPLTSRIQEQHDDDGPHKSINTTKKWVRGRLVEVLESS